MESRAPAGESQIGAQSCECSTCIPPTQDIVCLDQLAQSPDLLVRVMLFRLRWRHALGIKVKFSGRAKLELLSVSQSGAGSRECSPCYCAVFLRLKASCAQFTASILAPHCSATKHRPRTEIALASDSIQSRMSSSHRRAYPVFCPNNACSISEIILRRWRYLSHSWKILLKATLPLEIKIENRRLLFEGTKMSTSSSVLLNPKFDGKPPGRK